MTGERAMLGPVPVQDREIVQGGGDSTVERCEHEGRIPRRVCDVCRTVQHVFAACSSQCLGAHLAAAHAGVPLDAALRARRTQAERNRRSERDWELFAPHRERLMAAIPTDPAGGSLCVLGAGKCDDLDLLRLAERFAVVHLVDLDDEALERARDRQPARLRDAIVLHGGVDLSGLLARIDEWGEAFPDDRALHQAVFGGAHGVVQKLAGPFDVTVSTCVLSQLLLPFQDTWAVSEETWGKLVAAVTAAHVGILAHATARHGAACLVFDVLSSDRAPGLRALAEKSSEQLREAAEAGARDGAMIPDPDPSTMLAQISQSGVAVREPAPRLIGPWLWNTGEALQLVYALSFRRP